jgi:hypothetical protein
MALEIIIPLSMVPTDLLIFLSLVLIGAIITYGSIQIGLRASCLFGIIIMGMGIIFLVRFILFGIIDAAPPIEWINATKLEWPITIKVI